MAETKIEWCHYTMNPWEGCSKVSEGCLHCYAEARANRWQTVKWGPQGTRRIASESSWRQPLKWNREAEKAGERRRVFCASLADVFEDRPELVEPRNRLWETIVSTPHLNWLLLTKRPENFSHLYPPAFTGKTPPNVWLGVSVENQAAADQRIPLLLQTPATVRFLSMEPLLEPVSLIVRGGRATHWLNGPLYHPDERTIDWVIVGGESGGKDRRMFHLGWARDLLWQCRMSGTPFFFKQAGSNPHDSHACETAAGFHRLKLIDPKGGDLAEIPADLHVREFPEAAHV